MVIEGRGASIRGRLMLREGEKRWILKDKSEEIIPFNDGEDQVRDLLALGVEDKGEEIHLHLKVRDLRRDAKNTSYYVLMDYNPLDGSFLLPDKIRGATDHPWDLALKVELSEKGIKRDVLWGSSMPPTLAGLENPEEIIRGVAPNYDDDELTISLSKALLEKIGAYPSKIYFQVFSVNNRLKRIADSLNYPKPWHNSNFLVGAYPVDFNQTGGN